MSTDIDICGLADNVNNPYTSVVEKKSISKPFFDCQKCEFEGAMIVFTGYCLLDLMSLCSRRVLSVSKHYSVNKSMLLQMDDCEHAWESVTSNWVGTVQYRQPLPLIRISFWKNLCFAWMARDFGKIFDWDTNHQIFSSYTAPSKIANDLQLNFAAFHNHCSGFGKLLTWGCRTETKRLRHSSYLSRINGKNSWTHIP